MPRAAAARTKTRNHLLVNVSAGMQSANVRFSVHPMLSGPIGAAMNHLSYTTNALIDSGSTSTVLGKKAWAAFRMDEKINGRPKWTFLEGGKTKTATGTLMDLYYIPVVIKIGPRHPFKTTVALQRTSTLDVLGFREMAKGDIQLR